MKTIKLFTATIALLSSLLCIGCDKIKSLADVDINTNTIVDIPVKLINSDEQSCEFNVSLAEIEELSQYLDKLKGLKIKDIELSVLNYDGADFNGDITITVDDAMLWTIENVSPKSIETISLKSDANLNEATLNQLGLKLLNGGTARGSLEVETASSTPITASFTVRCKFIINITANPID